MTYTVGSVPYLNAKPLVRMFEEMGSDSPVRVVYDVPSRLPALLASGEVQAILGSSIEALSQPNMRVAEGICIGSQRDVLSVKLFSKVPIRNIRTLALDQSSGTSNALAQIILKERYDATPEVEQCAPNLVGMLTNHDACVLIGDNGMREIGEGLQVLDLGQEWYELTGLPFVWAVWLGNETLTPELSGHLANAERWGQQHMDKILDDAPAQTVFTREMC